MNRFHERKDGGEQPARASLFSDISLKIVDHDPSTLIPHPLYIQFRSFPSAAQVETLLKHGDAAFRTPLLITANRVIVDGYARWALAKKINRNRVPCLEYALDDEKIIEHLLMFHQRINGLLDYSRIRIALTLEPMYEKRASRNQSLGGKEKHSSNLTNDERIDVRTELAKLASVSTGNITKVKQMLNRLDPRVEIALRTGKISIHRAWTWHKYPVEFQCQELAKFQTTKGIDKKSVRLIQRHVRETSLGQKVPSSLGGFIRAKEHTSLNSIVVFSIDVPGSVIFCSPEAKVCLEKYRDTGK